MSDIHQGDEEIPLGQLTAEQVRYIAGDTMRAGIVAALDSLVVVGAILTPHVGGLEIELVPAKGCRLTVSDPVVEGVRLALVPVLIPWAAIHAAVTARMSLL